MQLCSWANAFIALYVIIIYIYAYQNSCEIGQMIVGASVIWIALSYCVSSFQRPNAWFFIPESALGYKTAIWWGDVLQNS